MATVAPFVNPLASWENTRFTGPKGYAGFLNQAEGNNRGVLAVLPQVQAEQLQLDVGEAPVPKGLIPVGHSRETQFCLQPLDQINEIQIPAFRQGAAIIATHLYQEVQVPSAASNASPGGLQIPYSLQ